MGRTSPRSASRGAPAIAIAIAAHYEGVLFLRQLRRNILSLWISSSLPSRPQYQRGPRLVLLSEIA